MIGYAVTVKPDLASYRLRVSIPAPHMGLPYVIGDTGDISFFYKLGNPEIASKLPSVVFDVVNDHFDRYPSVKAMCLLADKVTCASETMAEIVRKHTGLDAVVIDDPYENPEEEPACVGDRVLWFGHTVNLPSINKYADRVRGLKLQFCTNHSAPGFIWWTPQSELDCLDKCAVVIVTGTNPGASSNRVVKALRAGRFVVCPEDCAESWKQFSEYIWIGDVRDGVEYALHNREEVCNKIRAAQEHIRDRFSPEAIGQQWADLFSSI